jgi:hypothetical protein
MNWHVYELLAIDFGWEHVKTVKDTLLAIASGPDELNHPDGLNAANAKAFLDAWESAKNAASEKGWEGDFRQEPSVFWLPSEGHFDYGFVFKQHNNGDTFVVSPHSLPWLARLA